MYICALTVVSPEVCVLRIAFKRSQCPNCCTLQEVRGMILIFTQKAVAYLLCPNRESELYLFILPRICALSIILT